MIFWAKFSRLLAHPFLPSLLSIFRGILSLFLPSLLFHPSASHHLWALGLFIFGSLTDYWDGWLARRYGHVSDFGKIIDPTMDKLIILAPLTAFVQMDYYSVWWAVPFFVREILVTFCRIGWMMEGKAIGAEKLGKIKFTFQTAMISSSFLMMLARDYSSMASLAPAFRGLTYFFLTSGVILTVWSGVTFFSVNRENLGSPAFAKFTSACGVGLLPKAPGTFGTLLGLILVPLIAWDRVVYASVFLFLLWSGYWAVKRLDLNAGKDPQYVVVDEVLGMLVTMILVPVNFKTLVLGFFLFRVFDIFKPPPVRHFERLPGFWGIVCDDLGAGVYAGIVLFYLNQL